MHYVLDMQTGRPDYDRWIPDKGDTIEFDDSFYGRVKMVFTGTIIKELGKVDQYEFIRSTDACTAEKLTVSLQFLRKLARPIKYLGYSL